MKTPVMLPDYLYRDPCIVPETTPPLLQSRYNMRSRGWNMSHVPQSFMNPARNQWNMSLLRSCTLSKLTKAAGSQLSMSALRSFTRCSRRTSKGPETILPHKTVTRATTKGRSSREARPTKPGMGTKLRMERMACLLYSSFHNLMQSKNISIRFKM